MSLFHFDCLISQIDKSGHFLGQRGSAIVLLQYRNVLNVCGYIHMEKKQCYERKNGIFLSSLLFYFLTAKRPHPTTNHFPDIPLLFLSLSISPLMYKCNQFVCIAALLQTRAVDKSEHKKNNWLMCRLPRQSSWIISKSFR